MEKGIIIVGPPYSGKTTKASEIASQFQEHQVTRIDGNSKNGHKGWYYYSQCSEDTKLVIVEEVDSENIEFYFAAVTSGIIVNKKLKPSFSISPKILLECKGSVTIEQIKLLGDRINRRFEVIECKNTIS